MRFRTTQEWRLDDTRVPANTIIDASAGDRWSKRVRGLRRRSMRCRSIAKRWRRKCKLIPMPSIYCQELGCKTLEAMASAQ